MTSRFQAALGACALLFAASGCGGSGAHTIATGGGSAPPPRAGTLTVTPAALSTLDLAGQTATFGVAEPNYGGAFTATADPATCASGAVTTASVAPASAPGPSATFTVTAGGSAGTCTIVVADASGQQQRITVTVTATQVNLR